MQSIFEQAGFSLRRRPLLDNLHGDRSHKQASLKMYSLSRYQRERERKKERERERKREREREREREKGERR